MLLEHIKQWLLIWRSIPCIPTESTIWTLHGQQSAVHCSSSKCGRNLPQNSLVLALLRAFCFCRFCSFLWILGSKLYSTLGPVRFQGQAGPPQVHVSTPLQGWIGSLAARGPFWQFLAITRLSIGLSINSSGKIRKQVVSQAQSLLSRTCVVIGFGSKFCGQKCVLWTLGRALGLLEQLSAFWEHLQAFWEPLDSHLTNIKTMHTRLHDVIPNGCEKQQQLSTSPSNHVIALGSSLYRFPCFRQHFSTYYDLSSKGFYINPLGSLGFSQMPSIINAKTLGSSGRQVLKAQACNVYLSLSALRNASWFSITWIAN